MRVLLTALADLLDASHDGADLVAGSTTLASRRECYDPKLLGLVHEALLPKVSKERELEAMPVLLTLAALTPGQVLAADAETADGTMLVTAGQTITAAILERLANFASTVGVREPIVVRGAPTPIAAVKSGA